MSAVGATLFLRAQTRFSREQKMSTTLTIQILIYMAIVAFGCGVYGYRSGYRDGYANGKRVGRFQGYKNDVNQ